MQTPHFYDPLQTRVVPHTKEILDACLVLWEVTEEAGYRVSRNPMYPVRIKPDLLEYYWVPEGRKFTYPAVNLWRLTQEESCADLEEAREQLTQFCDLLESDNAEEVKIRLEEIRLEKELALEEPWINIILRLDTDDR
jgi:hypothetical protein